MIRKRKTDSHAQYQTLESKNLLAGITLDTTTGIVEIDGTSSNDQVLVLKESVNQIKIQFEGVEERVFDRSDVSEIVFRARGGDDFFDNRTAEKSRAYGHNGNDTLIGGDSRDRLRGGKGNDQINGNAGGDIIGGGGHDDLIFGGPGNDVISGLWGRDSIFGQDGDDQIDSGDGDDFVQGGRGDDSISGRNGDDDLRGGKGNDYIEGLNGNDKISGNDGQDDLYGNNGHDKIYGGSHDDSLYGGNGFDDVFGNHGLDAVFGGLGDDDLYGGAGSDDLRGGGGNDDFYSDGSDNIFDDSHDSNLDGDFEIRGEITNFNGNTQTFRVLGVLVSYGNAQFVASNIGNGSFVKAEGAFDGSLLNAREVELENDTDRDENIEARGIIESLNPGNHSFSFFGFDVSYAGAEIEGQVSNGSIIELEGRLTGNQIQAFEIEASTGGNGGGQNGGDDDQDDNQNDLQSNIELRGSVTGLNNSSQTFNLLGLTIDFSAAQIQGNINNGVFVKIDGTFGNDSISAREVEIELNDDNDENFEGIGPIKNLNSNQQTFELFGFLVQYENADIEVELTNNTIVSVEGFYSSGTILADKIN